MNRRRSKNYTIWIARTGREPIVLSLRPLVILLAMGLPTALIGGMIFLFARHNNQLSQRNSQLTEEADSILEQVEALESTLINLQERAKISQEDSEDSNSTNDANSADLTEAGEFDDIDNPESALDEENQDFDAQPTAPTDDADVEENGELNYYQSRSLSGGVGGPIGAEGLLAAARAKLPDLVKALEGEVEPALQEIIVREEAKPHGVPLTAKDTEVTSGFGFRANPFGWGYEFHQGLDFVAAYGSPVYATASGIVVKAEWEPGYGNHVIVDHGYGLESLYAHLSDVKVDGGDRIKRQQVLGYLGNTGRSSGPHLHYSVFRNGQAVDPRKYLD